MKITVNLMSRMFFKISIHCNKLSKIIDNSLPFSILHMSPTQIRKLEAHWIALH